MAKTIRQLSDALKFLALASLLETMQEGGSSVTLNYGEDTGHWECSWIVGGERFTEVRGNPDDAARACVRRVRERLMAHQAPGGERG